MYSITKERLDGGEMGTLKIENNNEEGIETSSITDTINKFYLVIKLKKDGTIFELNCNALNVFGYNENEILGNHHRKLCYTDYTKSKKYEDFWLRLNNGFIEREVYCMKDVNGSRVFLDGNYLLQNIDDEEFYVFIGKDVTSEYKKNIEHAEKVAAFDQEKVLIEFDLNKNIICVNKKFSEILGFNESEVLNKTENVLLPVNTQSELEQVWPELLQGKSALKRIVRRSKKLELRVFKTVYFPVKTSDGQVLKVVSYSTDITDIEKKSAEFKDKIAALDKSQAIIEFSLDGTILDANENFLKTLGYSDKSEIVGHHHRIFCDEGYAKTNEYSHFWDKLKQGLFDYGEYKRITRDKREIWIQATYNPIYDMDGNLSKVVKFASDITEEKNKTFDNNGKINAIYANLAIIEFETDGTIITANKNFLDVVKYPLEEIQGKHHRIFCDEKYIASEEYVKFWQDLSRGIAKNGEFKRFNSEKEEFWIHANYTPILDEVGNVIKIVKFASDITRQKRESYETDAKLEGINRNQAVIEFDLEGKVITANKNFEIAFGYSIEEIRGRHHRTFCDPEYVKTSEYYQFWERLFAGEYDNGVYQRFGKEGKCVWIKASYNPILDFNGEVVKIIKFAQDITTDVAARESLRKLTDDTARKLKKSMGKITDATKLVSENSGGVVDASENISASILELNHTTASIISNTKNANDLAKETDKACEQGISLIEQSVDSMGKISESTGKVQSITDLISEIASQTNLLAFNATVEAVRAGEHGQGFMIVADEVRKLAEKSSSAAAEIAKILAESNANTAKGTEVLKQTGTVFKQINKGVSKTAEAMESIITFTQEQEKVSKVVTSNIKELRGKAQLTTESSRNILYAIDKLEDSTEELVKHLNTGQG